MDDRDDKEKTQHMVADKIVLEYLRKRGYKKAEQALLRHDLGSAGVNAALVERTDLAVDDAEVDDDLRNVVMMLNRPSDLADNDARRFEESYCELRDWVDNSLDIYKAELHSVLYPLLVHCFLEIVRREHLKEARAFLQRCSAEFSEGAGADGSTGRRDEIMSLRGISSTQHLEENATAKLFLNNRYEIHLSSYGFELIISFLAEDPRRAVLLRILNQQCRVRLDAPADISGRAAAGGLLLENAADKQGFVSAAEKAGLLAKDVLWGRLRPEHYMIPDEGEPPSKGKGKGKTSADKAKIGGEGKPKSDATKKDGAGDEDEEPVTREDGTISESRIPLKKYRFGAPGLETLVDRKNRAKLDLLARDTESARSELAILCYTFTNTKDDRLNCSAISEDGSQVVAGFGDSTLRIWDARGSGTAGSGAGGLGGRATRLIGHAGPVYSVDWSKCGRFILSGSGDGTVRLWSAPLKTNVVAYRGHNYPVWSVEFSAVDHYFASGGYDRTARAWSTERTSPLRIFAGHLADVDAVRWHPNCNYVATGSSDRTARLWDMRDGKCARVFGPQGGTVHAVAFSADGKTVACGGDGRYVEVWDIRMGTRITRLEGHRSTVLALEYSREGGVLASGGADNAVCVWNASEWSGVVEPLDETALVANGLGNGNGNGNGAVANGALEGNEIGGDGGGMSMGIGGGETRKEGANGPAVGVVAAANGHGGGGGSGTGSGGGEGRAVANGAGGAEGVGKKREQEREKEEGKAKRKGKGETLIGRYETKETPIQCVKFTRRNLLIAAGSFAGG